MAEHDRQDVLLLGQDVVDTLYELGPTARWDMRLRGDDCKLLSKLPPESGDVLLWAGDFLTGKTEAVAMLRHEHDNVAAIAATLAKDLPPSCDSAPCKLYECWMVCEPDGRYSAGVWRDGQAPSAASDATVVVLVRFANTLGDGEDPSSVPSPCCFKDGLESPESPSDDQ